ncbi:MAG TPA: TrmH family RNA methyltransferase [Spirochaetia bacterium]|nr:TrmH family RNA methyltransferase [Spirochaetia bacterium]
MIPLAKLAKLSPRHRMRKAALLLAEAERELLRLRAAPAGADTGSAPMALPLLLPYLAGLGRLLAEEAEAPEAARGAAAALALAAGGRAPGSLGTVPADLAADHPDPGLLRAVDSLRHALLAATGQAPADWDLLDPATGLPDRAARSLRPGMRAYLEDLRSPFNVGSAFRTADAFGLEELLLSPMTADPTHPRAERSAMGAVGLVPWRRAGLECLASSGTVPSLGPAFALELGGTPIGEFRFPSSGIVVLGSEELGVSPEALSRCELGSVSIPMAGAKGSLNASVAFGILLYAWSAYLDRAAGRPHSV